MQKTRLIIILLIFLIGGLSWHVSSAQPIGEQYFNETGHWVRGEFLKAYYRTPYHDELYGQPISTYFKIDDTLYVQYFQKARFELRVDPQAGQSVQQSKLGELTYQPGKGVPFTDNQTNCRSFPENRHGKFEVCSSFLEYFDSHGGLTQFGSPISGTEILNGSMVQYFENARLEFRPELPAGHKVVVTDLGIVYFHYIRENRAYLMPEPGDPTIEGTIRLKARAYPLKAVTEFSGNQTIYVVVQDQRLLAASGVLVYFEVKMPNGETAPTILPAATDENGVAVVNFPYKTVKPGVVEILVNVKTDTLETHTITSFRTWW